MPRIPGTLINYLALIHTKPQDGKYGAPVGAGVLVALPTGRRPDEYANYVVTNHHVVANGGSDIRLGLGNDKSYRSTAPGEWEHAPHDDLAVYYAGEQVATDETRIAFSDILIPDDFLDEHDVGHGDDLFAMGSGGAANDWEPVMRFGNISSWPPEPMTMANGAKAELFLAEMRSRGGHSGSPIFLLLSGTGPTGEILEGRRGWGLLGMTLGHLKFDERVKVTEDDRPRKVSLSPAPPADSAANSGQMMFAETQADREIHMLLNTNTSLAIPVSKIRALVEEVHATKYP